MKILIVDDSPDALAVARARLSKEGLDIVCADSGQAGLTMARDESPDLILLDVDMPDLSGFHVCRMLQADPQTRTIPVIFLSGFDDADTKVRALDMGAVDYVTKPFDAFELRARVRAALRTKHLQDLLAKYAQIDPLTELLNRRGLTERMRREWASVRRHGGTVSFVMADIDHFKRVNDAHGHSTGDRALRHIADLLAAECRENDSAARYGGDEFAILCPDIDAASAASLAERCRQRIETTPFYADGQQLQLMVSFGVDDAAGRGNERDLIEGADRALYQAKEAGRNRVIVASATPATPAADSHAA